jgi:hypothetical protein
MNSQELDQKLLDLAIEQTAYFLSMVPARDSNFIVSELFKNTYEKFREHQQRLNSLQILEIADWEFEVKANSQARATLLIELKSNKNQNPNE